MSVPTKACSERAKLIILGRRWWCRVAALIVIVGIVQSPPRAAAATIPMLIAYDVAVGSTATDGFGRVATIADGAQTTSHTIYDARDRPVARIVNRDAALPPTIDPASLSSVQGLLSATFVTYGSDGQLESSRVYAMGPGGVEPISAEVFARNYTTNSATRTVNTSAGVLVRTQKWDPLGRLVEDSNNIDQSLKVSYPSLDARVLSARGPDGSYIVTTEYLNQFGGVLRRVDGKGSVLIERVADPFGRTISETAAGGDQVDVAYDAWSRIHSVTERVAGEPSNALVKKAYNFDQRGRLGSVDHRRDSGQNVSSRFWSALNRVPAR